MSKTIPYSVGMRYKLRNGDTAKIIHIISSRGEKFPVVGLMYSDDGIETLQSWTDAGRFSEQSETSLDLLPIEAVDYEAMAKQLAIALRDVVRNAELNIGDAYGGTSLYQSEIDKLDHAKMWLGSAQKAGLIP
jgi:hypothetical protein